MGQGGCIPHGWAWYRPLPQGGGRCSLHIKWEMEKLVMQEHKGQPHGNASMDHRKKNERTDPSPTQFHHMPCVVLWHARLPSPKLASERIGHCPVGTPRGRSASIASLDRKFILLVVVRKQRANTVLGGGYISKFRRPEEYF